MKDKYREETNKDVYTENVAGDYTNEYVHWLEDQLSKKPSAEDFYEAFELLQYFVDRAKLHMRNTKNF